MAMKLKRPTKGMMLAVNASIDGKTAEVNKLTNEHKLSKTELQQRLEMRQGDKYDLTKGTGPRGPRKARATADSDGIVSMIDGRTKVATLLRLEERVKEVLAQKPKAEVTKTKDAMKNIDKLRAQLEEAESLLGDCVSPCWVRDW